MENKYGIDGLFTYKYNNVYYSFYNNDNLKFKITGLYYLRTLQCTPTKDLDDCKRFINKMKKFQKPIENSDHVWLPGFVYPLRNPLYYCLTEISLWAPECSEKYQYIYIFDLDMEQLVMINSEKRLTFKFRDIPNYYKTGKDISEYLDLECLNES